MCSRHDHRFPDTSAQLQQEGLAAARSDEQVSGLVQRLSTLEDKISELSEQQKMRDFQQYQQDLGGSRSPGGGLQVAAVPVAVGGVALPPYFLSGPDGAPIASGFRGSFDQVGGFTESTTANTGMSFSKIVETGDTSTFSSTPFSSRTS